MVEINLRTNTDEVDNGETNNDRLKYPRQNSGGVSQSTTSLNEDIEIVKNSRDEKVVAKWQKL